MGTTNKTRHKRDANATKARILSAATSEFSENGLGGARVDIIAERSQSNKGMIYQYFGNKEQLFTAVLEDIYQDIRNAEEELDFDSLPPKEALEKLVRFTWQYYLDNPGFLSLVNSANLHKAEHIKDSKIIKKSRAGIVQTVDKILQRGVKEGVFQEGIDPVQLNITIAAIGYYYLTNRYTGSIVYNKSLMSKKSLEERLKFNLWTISRLVCK